MVVQHVLRTGTDDQRKEVARRVSASRRRVVVHDKAGIRRCRIHRAGSCVKCSRLCWQQLRQRVTGGWRHHKAIGACRRAWQQQELIGAVRARDLTLLARQQVHGRIEARRTLNIDARAGDGLARQAVVHHAAGVQRQVLLHDVLASCQCQVCNGAKRQIHARLARLRHAPGHAVVRIAEADLVEPRYQVGEAVVAIAIRGGGRNHGDCCRTRARPLY